MRSGYKIRWTNHALSELEATLKYLEKNWTERELQNFSRELDHTIELISKNPEHQTHNGTGIIKDMRKIHLNL